MDYCFLFVKDIAEDGCFSLKMSSEGAILAPLELRTFPAIKSLQKDSDTIVVETSTHVTLFDLELPWLPERKARMAIPYALEDKVAQSLDALHFAFDKLRYQNNHYLIVGISKHRIHYLKSLLSEHGITFDMLTLDWFALSPHELCVNESVLLVNNDDFKGALTGELADSYIKKNALLTPPLVFENSTLLPDNAAPKSNQNSYEWIAQKLLKTKPMNLCQGDMIHESDSIWLTMGYKLAGGLFIAWLVSLLITNALSLYFLNKKTADIDRQIAVIYREFFPDAKQIISPKFRITQLFESTNQDSQSHFWHLLNQFAKGMEKSSIKVEEMHYQNKTLFVTLISSDFASLEQLENQLKQLQLKVKQTQAATRDKHVLANLELT